MATDQDVRSKLLVRGYLEVEHYGADGQLKGRRFVKNLVTTVGEAYIAGALSGDTVTPSNLKYHGCGTGTTGPATGDTTLETEVETRATGNQSRTTTTHTDDTYTTVGTISITATRAITEWGIFDASTSGSMAARQTFAALNVVEDDSIQFTWTLPCADA